MQTIIKFDGADFQKLYAKRMFDSRVIDIKVLFEQLVNITSTRRNLKLTYHSAATGSSGGLDELSQSLNKLSIGEKEDLEKLRGEISTLNGEENFSECLQKLEKALKIDSNCIEFLCQAAECMIKLEKFEGADKMIAKAVAINPAHVNVLFVQGLKKYHDGDLKASREKFNEVLEYDPGFTKAAEMKESVRKLLNFLFAGERHLSFLIDGKPSNLRH
jgi:tetratricopeptide (TPR) repeat protein